MGGGVATGYKWRQKRKREVACVPGAAAIHKWGPWQNKPKPNNLQLAANPTEQDLTHKHAHTHSHCLLMHTHTKPIHYIQGKQFSPLVQDFGK